MRTSPPIAPSDLEHATYLVLDDFGRIGRAWREAAEEAADRETAKAPQTAKTHAAKKAASKKRKAS